MSAAGGGLRLPDGTMVASITPEPTEAERAAIEAAVEALWPQLWTQPTLEAPAPSPRWRYAGRPWRRRSSYGGWT